MPRGLSRCLEVIGLLDKWMWTGTIWMLLYFEQNVWAAVYCMFTYNDHYFQLVSAWLLWSVMIQLKFVLPVEQVEVLNVLSGQHPFVTTASSLMSETVPRISFLSIITYHPFLLTLWCPLTTPNITSNLNMSALLKLGDARKLGCRNWLRVTRTEVDGNILLEEAKDHPRAVQPMMVIKLGGCTQML